ncbi:MAG: tetratricopeptide repeat protein, partial [Candidatus Riflebacteria bacterium]|nr:tetratricopeptide repeat protein [Candidatus Riflebacteria bacterium]
EAYEHYLNAEKLVQSGKRAQAIKEFQLVKKLLPEESKQLNDLISLHISIGIGQEEEGMDKDLLFECLFENLKFISVSGNQKELARIYNALGNAYSDIGAYDKAVDYHKKSLSIRPDPFHYQNLAICYTSMGKYYDAIEIYEKIKKVYPQVEQDIKPDYQIERINGIISGKINPNEKIDDNKILADEQSKKGDLQFDKQNYVKAIENYNAAFGIKETIAYLYKILLSKNIYESPYYEESEQGFSAVDLCAKEDDFKYLPFVCTVYGDALSYEAWGKSKLSLEYYEMAVFLLDMVPIKERFAAPYYKLARLKEEAKNYKEALKLFEQTKEIDKNYSVEGDINRIKNILDGKEEFNQKEFTNHYEQMKKYQKAKIFNMFIEEGKKALEYSPNNIKIYYLIATSTIKIPLPFEAKWAIKEGLRLELDKYDEDQLFYKCILILGKCCKYEMKKEQAKYYFDVILESEDDRLRDYYQEAQTESFSLEPF